LPEGVAGSLALMPDSMPIDTDMRMLKRSVAVFP
jgi:hypothetical protein